MGTDDARGPKPTTSHCCADLVSSDYGIVGIVPESCPLLLVLNAKLRGQKFCPPTIPEAAAFIVGCAQ